MPEDEKATSWVSRPKAAIKANYDRLSRWYDLIAGRGERKTVMAGLHLLAASEGETVLEIGYGTGRALVVLAQAVGETGRVIGIDLSEGMRRVASRRLRKAGLTDRVTLICGDAANLADELEREAALPLSPSSQQPLGLPVAIFMSFTLELFDQEEIPIVLRACRRVLRTGGRIAVVSMKETSRRSVMVRLYGWAHGRIPRVVDCRPIDAARLLEAAGFRVEHGAQMSLWGLPVSVTLATKP